MSRANQRLEQDLRSTPPKSPVKRIEPRMRHALMALFLGTLIFTDGVHGQASVSDVELARGMRKVESGDFEVAIGLLEAAVNRLREDESRRRDLALAYHYLGVAHAGRSQEMLAKARFLESFRSGGNFGESEVLRTFGRHDKILELEGPRGQLLVAVWPWAEVSVDGAMVGTTPFGKVTLREGPHLVRAVHPAFEPVDREIIVRAGQVTKLVLDLKSEAPRVRP